jgi:hypothetical protein
MAASPELARVRRLEGAQETRMPMTRVTTEHRPIHYHCAALAHYSVIFPAIAAAALTMVSWVMALAVFCAGELLVVGVLPRFGAFRRSVDARFERCVAVTMRLDVLERMSDAHRAGFEQLERLAGQIRERCGRVEESGRHDPPDLTVERWLGLERLVAIYAELAISHRLSTESFLPEDGVALAVERDEVRALAASGVDGSAWLQRRRTILQRRHETWMDAAAEREFLLQGLATIMDVVRYMHELCGAVPGTRARANLDDVLESWEANGATLREVSGLCRGGAIATVDPRLLALGREELTLRHEQSSSARTTDCIHGSDSDLVPRSPRVQPSPPLPVRA